MATVNETAIETAATSKDMPVLQNGDNPSKGRAVAYLQYLLISYGEDVGTSGVDGEYGPDTKAAVEEFQRERNQVSDVNPGNLKINGVVALSTWRALGDNFYRTCRTSADNSPVESDFISGGIDLPRLSRNDKGDAVRFLQQLLLGYDDITGYTNDSFDADFGPETERAVKAFQSSSGLDDDGIVGRDTWAKLFEGSRERCNGSVS
ncbi:peptidoglycan-binding domain-containing protein [Brasilonema bromeliae]|uniref:Peptidoglycan binding-like domain-containing protein n=1 Tax=Brasilonema bromeliae SPC951 TaxID=385972 RepID=A0ABX1P8N8_9CYAN|nr:peptidoglycan-binding protein [Brasilonema bromeliae]NMG20291.1 hypothetical protein [Brasilonema bromeliae SPC951]